MRILVWLGAALLLLSMLVVIVALWAVHTESGARWALERAARTSGAVSFDDISGTLFGRLDIGSLHYADESAEVTANSVSLQVESDRLLAGELRIRELTAEALSYTPRPTTGKKKTAAAPALPIDLAVDDVRIGRIVIHGERDEHIDNVAARAEWRGNMVNIESLVLTVRDFEVQIAGTVQLRDVPVVDVSVDWRSLADAGLRGSGRVSGDTANLAVQHELAGQYSVSTQGTVEIRDDAVLLDLANSADRIDYIAGERTLQFSNPRLAVSGPLDNYKLQWDTSLQLTGLPMLQISGNGSGNLQQVQIDNLAVTPPRGRLNAGGVVSWSPAVSWNLDLSGVDIDPALVAEQWPGDIDGSLLFSGSYDDSGLRYQVRNIDLSGTLRDKRLSVSGNLQQSGDTLALEQLRILAGTGSISGTGNATIGETLRWQSALSLQDIDPSFVATGWPGKLSGNLQFSGSRSASATSIALQDISIAGRLRDQPLQLRGTVRHDGKTLQLSRVDARSGNNKVRLDGSIGRRLEIAYDADITDLGTLGAQFEGSLTGKGRIAGTTAAPIIELNLNASGLQVPGYAIGSLRADGELAPVGRQATLEIDAADLAVRDQQIDKLSATVRGSLDNHEIALQLDTPAGDFSARLAGGWQDEQWRGQLADSRFELQQYGVWQQESAARLLAALTGAQAGELCWRQDSAAVCIDGGVDNSALALSANARDIPVDLLRRFLPPGTTAAGTINADARLRGTTSEPLLEYSAGATQVDLSYRYAEDEDPVSAAMQDISLNGVASLQTLTARLSLSGPDQARLLFDGQLTDWRKASPRVAAGMDASLPDATLLGLISTRVSNVSGSLRVDGRIEGDLRQPVFSGYALLDNARAAIPAAGISLTDARLELRPAGPGQVAITGAASSGGGRIELAGSLRLDAAAGWPLSGTITGQRFSAVQLPGIEVAVSPDLRLGGNVRELKLDGNVVANRAIVEFKELPEQAVRLSPDVVVAGAQQSEKQRASMLQLSADLNVQLGEEVSFSGFGLRTGLDGELALRLLPGRPPQGRGLITLESGRFQAYGQNLVIDNGTLLFTGDLEDPTLDVEAVRSFDEVRVGIRLSGTGRAPVSTIFSEPAMAEADALSYLVIGRPLAEATAAEGRSIQNSALLLGATHAAAITDQIGQSVGLDELRLDTRNIDTGAIMAGKRISPDLYIRYSYGLFSRIGALLLRYRLNSRMSLEARSGEDQSLDLIYTRESN